MLGDKTQKKKHNTKKKTRGSSKSPQSGIKRGASLMDALTSVAKKAKDSLEAAQTSTPDAALTVPQTATKPPEPKAQPQEPKAKPEESKVVESPSVTHPKKWREFTRAFKTGHKGATSLTTEYKTNRNDLFADFLAANGDWGKTAARVKRRTERTQLSRTQWVPIKKKDLAKDIDQPQ